MADTPHLHLAGIPVRVDRSFFVIAVLLGWSPGRPVLSLVTWVAIVLVSVLAHELGHGLALRAYGLRPRILLYAMGGLTFHGPSPGRPLGPWRQIAVSLAGPAVGLALGAAVVALRGSVPVSGPLAATVLRDLVWVNVGWGVLNLVPMLPLDGGNVLKSFCDLATGGRGERPARIVSLAVAGLALLAALQLRSLWIAFVVVFLGASNLSALRGQRATGAPAPSGAGRDAPGRPAPAGLDDAREHFAAAPGDATGAALARELLRAGRLDEALALQTGPHAGALGAETAKVLLVALFGGGRYAEAAAAGARGWERNPDPRLAYDVACAWARAGNPGEAVAWLERAVQGGWQDPARLDADPDLDALRGTPAYEALRRRVG
ncbi:MAG: hypothetical protein H0V05_13220 [Euzebyaceae bacterium]|nr:hypothetical protein [Euzebyaceae bacterium]